MRNVKGGSSARKVPDGYVQAQIVLKTDESGRVLRAIFTEEEWASLRLAYLEEHKGEKRSFVGSETILPDIFDVAFIRRTHARE